MPLNWNHEMQQDPDELQWFADRLIAADVEKLLTIGVFHGGVEWYLARRYQAVGKRLLIHAVDPYMSPGHPDVHRMIDQECPLVEIRFAYCKIEHFDLSRCEYDAVFVDGDHSEESVRHDVALAVRTARKLVAMHDIVDGPKGWPACAAVWAELCASVPEAAASMTAHPGENMGIGIIYVARLA